MTTALARPGSDPQLHIRATTLKVSTAEGLDFGTLQDTRWASSQPEKWLLNLGAEPPVFLSSKEEANFHILRFIRSGGCAKVALNAWDRGCHDPNHEAAARHLATLARQESPEEVEAWLRKDLYFRLLERNSRQVRFDGPSCVRVCRKINHDVRADGHWLYGASIHAKVYLPIKLSLDKPAKYWFEVLDSLLALPDGLISFASLHNDVQEAVGAYVIGSNWKGEDWHVVLGRLHYPLTTAVEVLNHLGGSYLTACACEPETLDQLEDVNVPISARTEKEMWEFYNARRVQDAATAAAAWLAARK